MQLHLVARHQYGKRIRITELPLLLQGLGNPVFEKLVQEGALVLNFLYMPPAAAAVLLASQIAQLLVKIPLLVR